MTEGTATSSSRWSRLSSGWSVLREKASQMACGYVSTVFTLLEARLAVESDLRFPVTW